MPTNPIQDSDSPGRVVGVDFGTKRIGLAITDQGRSIASPLVGYERTSPDRDAAWFLELVRQEEVVQFVVGLPLHHSGDESQKSQEARSFGAWLQHVTGVPVDFHDERYSTRQADDWMQGAKLTKKQQKSRRDMLAAQTILASYLESDSPADQPLDDD